MMSKKNALLVISLSALASLGWGASSRLSQASGASGYGRAPASAMSGFCSASRKAEGRRTTDAGMEWIGFAQSKNRPSGVALVVHGLNTRPSKMRQLAELLAGGNIPSLAVTLSGHGGDLDVFKQVSRSQWLSDFSRSYCEARVAADRFGVPLYFVGFSLGAALGLDLLSEEGYDDVRFDRMVLLAPAAEVKSTSRLIKLMKVAGPKAMIPSMNHPDYRANGEGTSVAAYSALFDTIDRLPTRNFHRANVPTLVLVDPRDELVSSKGLQQMIRVKSLDRWSLVEISNGDSKLSPTYHHLIIDEASLGSRIWSDVSKTILAHLNAWALPRIRSLRELCATAKVWKTDQNGYCSKDYFSGCDRETIECTGIIDP